MAIDINIENPTTAKVPVEITFDSPENLKKGTDIDFEALSGQKTPVGVSFDDPSDSKKGPEISLETPVIPK